MSDETKIIQQLHAEAAMMLRQGEPEEKVVTMLQAKGCDRRYAETILMNIREDAANKLRFRKTVFYGVGFLLAGFMLTFSSYYFSMSRGSGFYIFFWGLFAGGISIIARAFILYRK